MAVFSIAQAIKISLPVNRRHCYREKRAHFSNHWKRLSASLSVPVSSNFIVHSGFDNALLRNIHKKIINNINFSADAD